MLFNFKFLLSSTLLAASALALTPEPIEEDYTVTVTKTRTVAPPCLQKLASKALPGNPDGLQTGIQIVFVYDSGSPDPPDPPSNQGTVGSYSYITTTYCQNHHCKTYTIKDSQKTDTYSFDTPSVKTAPTTTSTVFKATSTPSPTIPKQTTPESITSKSAPVAPQTVVSESKSVTINPSSITDAVTLSTSKAGNESIMSSSSGYSNSTIATVHHTNSSTLSSASLHNSTTLATSSSTTTNTQNSPNVPPSPAPTCYSGDLFNVISTKNPPSVFPRSELPLAIPQGVNNEAVPIGTNKFYSNLFLDNQTDMIWTYPYGLYWSKTEYYGFGVQHTNVNNRQFAIINTNNEGVPSVYLNPVKAAELIFSATTFAKDSLYMGVSNMRSLSALVTLSSNPNDKVNYLDIPLVEGIGFVTGIYNGNLIAQLGSMAVFVGLELETSKDLPSNIMKYRARLSTDIEWLIYITLPKADDTFKLEVTDYNHLKASKNVDGLIIQVAVAPTDRTQDSFYDTAAGMYATTADIKGNVSCDANAQYSILYETSGMSSSGKPIIFALPHHLESLTEAVKEQYTGITIASTTKGNMVGFLTNELVFVETIETNIQFLPWAQTMTRKLEYTTDQIKLLANAANDEMAVNIADTVENMVSTYFSGKVMDKFAYILLVVHDIIQDKDVTKDMLQGMKDAFEVFTSNQQYYPLMYDTKFGGVTSTANQGGDTGADFGGGYYNDHHFHYGYFIHAAAVVGYVDQKLGGTWAQDNKDWVNALIRDVANPSEQDNYFPVSRMFDWYQGHSWAAGLFASSDGKNQESSSEDINFAYGMKLWGNVIGDHSMEARGGLMLSIMSRSFNLYFYYKSDNTVQPPEFIPNKVSGIFFENKVDYTTYFGAPSDNPEYVHGIHMLPITPASSSIRIPSYVQEEWEDQVSKFIGNVNDGWAGILRLNQALFDPASSYNFFASDSFTTGYLDNGQSRTWSLAFSAGVLNAS